MTLRSRLQSSIIVVSAMTLAGCDSVALSPRQQLVKDAIQAVCEARDLKGMLPFVTAQSRPLIEIASSIAAASSVITNSTLADQIAVECTDAALEFIDEVKVTDERYVVRSRTKGSADITQTIVVTESGHWKIAFGFK